ncbi:MAG: hypothetical protein KJO76_01510 [Gammaproteobacteria bacterium]|nr:hypothetical protein [Gammaproteobacteria bacterium]MBT8443815.1 hypothetical protein [Gammaproteobacteria bacterium]NND37326.1 hypothetical protein [Gammaproteobacteria bacterium]
MIYLKRVTVVLLSIAANAIFSPAASATDLFDPADVAGLQPFANGDVFVGATQLNNPEDDHAGRGRILQFDADLNLKGVLLIEGTTHLINGLTIAPDGKLWAFDLWAWTTVRVTPNGRQLPNLQFAERPFGGVLFADDGTLIFTEALDGDNQPTTLTTRHPVLPGQTTRLGDGNLYRFTPDGELLASYEPDIHGGVTGSFAVSHSAWSSDRKSVIYVSETGNRLMRYDVTDGRQLPDIPLTTDRQPQMLFALTSMSDERLLISMANRLELISESGDELRTYALEGFGWSVVALSHDERFAYVGNWYNGQFGKLGLDDGEFEVLTEVCVKCMASVTVYSSAVTTHRE